MMRGNSGAWRPHHWPPAPMDSCGRQDARSQIRSGLPLRFDVAREAVEDCLPATALLLDGVRILAVEGHAYRDAVRPRSKLDLRGPIAERIFDELVLDDLRIGSGKVEAHAAVLCLHARGKDATYSQIHRSSGGVPVVGGCVPLLDVFGCVVGPPDLLDGSGDVGFDGDFHGVPLVCACGAGSCNGASICGNPLT